MARTKMKVDQYDLLGRIGEQHGGLAHASLEPGDKQRVSTLAGRHLVQATNYANGVHYSLTEAGREVVRAHIAGSLNAAADQVVEMARVNRRRVDVKGTTVTYSDVAEVPEPALVRLVEQAKATDVPALYSALHTARASLLEMKRDHPTWWTKLDQQALDKADALLPKGYAA